MVTLSYFTANMASNTNPRRSTRAKRINYKKLSLGICTCDCGREDFEENCEETVKREGKIRQDAVGCVLPGESRVSVRTRYRFIFSGFGEKSDVKAELVRRIQSLGGIFYDTDKFKPNCTHVVCGRLGRSEKFLGACASGKWIVTPQFVIDSYEKQKWLDESDYKWTIRDLEENHSKVLEELCQAPIACHVYVKYFKKGLFHGLKIALLIEDKLKRSVYSRILQAGGAIIVKVSLKCIENVRKVDFIFVDKKNKLTSFLARREISLISTDFIRNYLLSKVTPDEEEFDIRNYVPNSDKFSTISMNCSPLKSSATFFIANSPLRKIKLKDMDHCSSPKLVPLIAQIDEEYVNKKIKTEKVKRVMRSSGKDIKVSTCNEKKLRKYLKVKSKKHKEKSKTANNSPGLVKSGSKRKTNSSENILPVKRQIFPETPKKIDESTTNAENDDCEIIEIQNLDTIEDETTPFIQNISSVQVSKEKLDQIWNDVKYIQRARLIERWKSVITKYSLEKPVFEYPDDMFYYLEQCYEKENLLESVSNYRSMLCQQYYFPETIMRVIVHKVLLEAPSHLIANETHDVLMHILEYHPPSSNKLRRWYEKLLENESISDLFSTVGKSINACCTPKDEPVDDVRCHSYALFLDYVRAILEVDFASYITKSNSAKSILEIGNEQPIIFKMLWPSKVINVNRECSLLLRYLVSAVMNKVPYNVISNLQSLVTLMMECCALSDVKELSYSKFIGEKCLSLIRELVLSLQSEKLDENAKLLKLMFETIQLSWVKMAVAQLLLDNTIFSRNSRVDCHSLTLENIVNNYMKATPVDVNNLQTPEKNLFNCRDKTQVTKLSKISPLKINWRNRRGEGHLHLACRNGEVERVRELLSQPECDVNLKDYAGWTPLHEACNFGHVECVRELLNYKRTKKSVDLSVVSSEGITPLHDAVLNNHLKVVELLLECGGHKLLEIKNSKTGQLPIDLAKTPEMAELLFDEKWKSKTCGENDVVEKWKSKSTDRNEKKTNDSKLPFQIVDRFVNLILNLLSSYLDTRHLQMFHDDHFNKTEIIALKIISNEYRDISQDFSTFINDLNVFINLDNHIDQFFKHISQMLDEPNAIANKLTMFRFLSINLEEISLEK